LPAISKEENRTVKRTVIIAAGVVALGLALYVGRLWAQTGGVPARPAAAPEPRTRVALINLANVIRNYDKFKTFQDELKGSVGYYTANEARWKPDAEKLARELQDPKLEPAQRDQKERALKDLQRKLEDNKAEANKMVGQKQEAQIKILYQDVQATVQRYALAHNFELVLHYNDAVDPQDVNSAQNIARKMGAGALMPMYWANGMDISQQIIATLNQAHRAAFPPRPAAGTAAPTGPAAPVRR
jgi:Skp family chaperone for outer membrane proteins